MCRDHNIENEVIPRIAQGFGGGFGGTGSVCGAVCGAVMALSLLKKRDNTEEGWNRLAAAVAEFRNRFEKEMGTIICRDLIGVDLTTEEGHEKLMNSDIPQKACIPAVNLAHKLVERILE